VLFVDERKEALFPSCLINDAIHAASLKL